MSKKLFRVYIRYDLCLSDDPTVLIASNERYVSLIYAVSASAAREEAFLALHRLFSDSPYWPFVNSSRATSIDGVI